ncbi:MAG: TolC family protein [Flavobacterium sp.]|uniref:TolC family protein n=1 Tax=Flavobacterium sp. TaxID=239 RepID=UPI0012243AC8|nr:TolC family protein [Flavobacterium sp.]RZJ68730.1 MAG: TolC family protein [Flavobacterium sp.]
MKKILSILTLLLVVSASAQQKPLTLKDAINYALQNKADSKKAKLDVENSEYEIQDVRSQALPQLSGNGNLTYNPILQNSALPGEFFGQPAGTIVLVPFGQKWSSTAGLALTQNVFDMSVFTGLKAAKSTREFYLINATLTDEQVIERVATAYYEVFVAQERLAVSDSTYNNTNRTRGVIQGQLDNGLAKRIDLDRTVVKLNNNDTERQKARVQVILNENALKFLIGMPVETPIVLAKDDMSVKPIELETKPDVTQLVEFQLMKKEEQLLEFQKKSKIAAFYPTLALAANYNYQGLGNQFPWGGKPADGVYWSDYSSIGMNLKIPIFTGFGNRAKVSKADVELRKQQVDIEDTKLRLSKDYEDAVANIRSNLSTLENQRANSTLAQSVLNDTRNNYFNGLATLTDLLEAENELTTAANNYNSALLEYKKAEIKLYKSKGELKNLTN